MDEVRKIHDWFWNCWECLGREPCVFRHIQRNTPEKGCVPVRLGLWNILYDIIDLLGLGKPPPLFPFFHDPKQRKVVWWKRGKNELEVLFPPPKPPVLQSSATETLFQRSSGNFESPGYAAEGENPRAQQALPVSATQTYEMLICSS